MKKKLTNEERLKFLNEKPIYHCHANEFHEVGCPHQFWTKEELQSALDKAKRTLELWLYEKLL